MGSTNGRLGLDRLPVLAESPDSRDKNIFKKTQKHEGESLQISISKSVAVSNEHYGKSSDCKDTSLVPQPPLLHDISEKFSGSYRLAYALPLCSLHAHSIDVNCSSSYALPPSLPRSKCFQEKQKFSLHRHDICRKMTPLLLVTPLSWN